MEPKRSCSRSSNSEGEFHSDFRQKESQLFVSDHDILSMRDYRLSIVDEIEDREDAIAFDTTSFLLAGGAAKSWCKETPDGG